MYTVSANAGTSEHTVSAANSPNLLMGDVVGQRRSRIDWGNLSALRTADGSSRYRAMVLRTLCGVFHGGGRAAPLKHASHVAVGNAGDPTVRFGRLIPWKRSRSPKRRHSSSFTLRSCADERSWVLLPAPRWGSAGYSSMTILPSICVRSMLHLGKRCE